MKKLVLINAATLLALACAPSQHPPAQKDSPVPPNPCAEIVPAAQGLAAEGWGQQALDLLNARCSSDVPLRALILARMGRVKEAEALLLADVASGETAEARQLVANAKQEQTRRKAAGGASERHVEAARVMLEQEKCEEAAAAAEQAIRSNFPSPDAWFEKARAHSCLGQPQQARLAFEQGLAEGQDVPRWQRSPGIAVFESEWVENVLLLLEEGAGAKAGWRVHRVKESWRLSKGPAPNHMVGHRLAKDLWQSGTSLFARTNGRTLEISVDFPVRAGAMNADRLVLIETQNYHRAPSFLHRFDLKTNEFEKRLQVPILVSVARVFLGEDWIAVSGTSGNDVENFETLLVLDAATGRLRKRLMGDCLPEFDNCYPGHSTVQPNEEELLFFCDEVLPPGSDPIEIQGIASFQPKTGKVALAYRPSDDVMLRSTGQENIVAMSSVDDTALLEKRDSVWRSQFNIRHRWHNMRPSVRISDNQRHAVVGGGWETETWDIEKKRREFRLNEEDSPDLGLTRSRSDALHTWSQNCDTMLSLSWLEGADVRKLEGVPCSGYRWSWVWWTPPTTNTSGIERRSLTANSAASADIIAGEASIDGCGASGLCSTLLYKGKRVFANSYQVPIGLSPNGQHAFFVHARERTTYARALPDGPILHKFPMETTKHYHVINVPNSTKALLWTDEGWRLVDLTDKPGQETSKLVQYSPTAQDITADMKLTVGADGLCDEQGKCTPLEGLKKARTRQGNEQPVVVSTKKDADPDSFETVLRFAANGKLVTGTSPRQLQIWDAGSGRYLGKYAVSSVGTWFFVAPGSGPQEERGVEFLNVISSEQETGLSCTVGDEWFPWEICEAHFRRDLLDESGLPHSARRLLQTN